MHASIIESVIVGINSNCTLFSLAANAPVSQIMPPPKMPTLLLLVFFINLDIFVKDSRSFVASVSSEYSQRFFIVFSNRYFQFM